MPMMVLVLAGCATYPSTLTLETKQKAKSVCIVKEVHAPSSISLPSSGGSGGLIGVIAAGIEAKMTKSFNNKLHSKLNTAEYLSQTLLSSFKSKLASCSTFALKTDETTGADASFVLEVTRAGLGPAKLFSGGAMPPQVTVVVTLISNPPFELMRDQYGKITTEDPVQHEILYQEVVSVGGGDGLPYHKKDEYLSKDVFEKAFGQAISVVVDKITVDW